MINAYAGNCRCCHAYVMPGAGSAYKQRWQKNWSVYCNQCNKTYAPMFDELRDLSVLKYHPKDHEYEARTTAAGYQPESDLCRYCGFRPDIHSAKTVYGK